MREIKKPKHLKLRARVGCSTTQRFAYNNMLGGKVGISLFINIAHNAPRLCERGRSDDSPTLFCARESLGDVRPQQNSGSAILYRPLASFTPIGNYNLNNYKHEQHTTRKGTWN